MTLWKICQPGRFRDDLIKKTTSFSEMIDIIYKLLIFHKFML